MSEKYRFEFIASSGSDSLYNLTAALMPVAEAVIRGKYYFLYSQNSCLLQDSKKRTSELIVRAAKLTAETKPKAFIHWVAKPLACEVRLYDKLYG